MEKKKILIIDDEEDFGFLLKNFFSQKNYDVFVALTLREGMKILGEENPDIVFLDNNLPDGFGWSETANILMDHPRIQLNLISALSVPKTSASSFQILEKPLRLDWLKEMAEGGFSSRKN